MKTPGIARRIDEVLRPFGFERREATWNRRRGRLVDVAELLVGKTGDRVTVDLGIFDGWAYQRVYDLAPPAFPEAPHCAARVRLGALAYSGKDHWWQLDDEGVAEVLARSTTDYGLPWFDRFSMPHALADWLQQSRPVRNLVPPETLYFAVLLEQDGERESACDVARRFVARARGAWAKKAHQLLSEFACGEESVAR